MRKITFKKKFFILVIIYFFANDYKCLKAENNIFNRMLVGIDLAFGLDGNSNKDFYFQFEEEYIKVANGAQIGDQIKKRSVDFNYEFDSAFLTGLSFDYVSSNGLLYGFEINYGQSKGIDSKNKTTFLTLNQKNIMVHGGYMMNLKSFFPYFSIGVGLDNIELEGKIPWKDTSLLSLKFEKGFFDYKRVAISGSAGVSIDINNCLVGVGYKFLGSFNFNDDIVQEGPNGRSALNPDLKLIGVEFAKFLTQTHMVNLSIKIPI